ncbi:MAG: amidase family protein [Oscillospiraceae bacterium]|nr:amidase family protein [Oscillospiraceae bacterium]
MKTISIKDDICIKGELTTCGSKMLANFKPPYNATVVDKLAAACFNVIGGNTMDENSSIDADFALCSDHAGLARRFAMANSLIALKPTYGSVSRYGLITPAPSLDQISPIGKTVRDVAELYSVICGMDERDSTTVERDYPNFCENLDKGIEGIIVGTAFCRPQQNILGGKMPPLQKTIPIELPSIEYASTVFQIIAYAETFSNLARYDGIKFGYRSENAATLAELYENTRAEGFGYDTKKQIITGAIALSRDNRHLYYDRAIRGRAKLCAELDNAFAQSDVIITPLDDSWTVIPNLTGCPAIAVGGIQIIAPKFSEELLFRAARTIEIAGGDSNA